VVLSGELKTGLKLFSPLRQCGDVFVGCKENGDLRNELGAIKSREGVSQIIKVGLHFITALLFQLIMGGLFGRVVVSGKE